MAKSLKNVGEGIELEPDAWSRFEQFVSNIASAGPNTGMPK
jgi:hypothetical protein